jgi:hypothetical protein
MGVGEVVVRAEGVMVRVQVYVGVGMEGFGDIDEEGYCMQWEKGVRKGWMRCGRENGWHQVWMLLKMEMETEMFSLVGMYVVHIVLDIN